MPKYMTIKGSWISKLIKVLGLLSPFLYIYAKIYDHNDFVKIVNFKIIYIERESIEKKIKRMEKKIKLM